MLLLYMAFPHGSGVIMVLKIFWSQHGWRHTVEFREVHIFGAGV
jgi:hypothetical protein